MKRSAVVMLSCMLSACTYSGVGNYLQPLESEPHAVLNFVSQVKSLTFSNASQYYSGFEDASCITPPTNTFMALMYLDTPAEIPIKIKPGKKIFLRGATVFSPSTVVGGQIRTGNSTCANLVSFTPEPGRTYDVKQVRASSSCEMSVLDADGFPPGDLAELPVTGACVFTLVTQDLR